MVFPEQKTKYFFVNIINLLSEREEHDLDKKVLPQPLLF